MPTVLRVGGFAFSFYSNDHTPPHVHVERGDAVAIVEIETGLLRKSKGMKIPDVLRAIRLVEQHQERLLAAWVAFDRKRRQQNGLASN